MRKDIIKTKKITLLAISFLAISGFLVASFQSGIIKIKADEWPITVSTEHIAFGTIFPGEQVEKSFTVTYDGDGEEVEYTITKKYKPLPDAVVPEGYDGTISDYCQDHFDDLERCYRNLCPYINEYSNEEEGDTIIKASVSAGDFSDVWTIHLDAPAIVGKVSQDHTGGIISVNGVYGCDLSFNLDVLPEGSVSGCKYNDINNNGTIDDGEVKLSGWEIRLIGCPYSPLEEGALEFLPVGNINTNPQPGESGYCSVIKTITTDSNGCYTFDGLEKGDYGVSEKIKENWTQTLPADNKFYYFSLRLGEDKTEIDFANFIESAQPYCGDGNLDAGEQCDDGNNINGDGCSASCTTEGGGGGGGGGVYLAISSSEDCVVTENGASFSWRTNKTASTRVVCDTERNPNFGSPPDYGYEIYTEEFDKDPRVLIHGVEITGLEPGKTYYCRVISSDSSSTVFEERICSIPGPEPEPEPEEEGEVKGVDIVIPEALPKTGLGPAASAARDAKAALIFFATIIPFVLLQYERKK